MSTPILLKTVKFLQLISMVTILISCANNSNSESNKTVETVKVDSTTGKDIDDMISSFMVTNDAIRTFGGIELNIPLKKSKYAHLLTTREPTDNPLIEAIMKLEYPLYFDHYHFKRIPIDLKSIGALNTEDIVISVVNDSIYEVTIELGYTQKKYISKEVRNSGMYNSDDDVNPRRVNELKKLFNDKYGKSKLASYSNKEIWDMRNYRIEFTGNSLVSEKFIPDNQYQYDQFLKNNPELKSNFLSMHFTISHKECPPGKILISSNNFVKLRYVSNYFQKSVDLLQKQQREMQMQKKKKEDSVLMDKI